MTDKAKPLTDAQQRLMNWLAQGWTAHQEAVTTIHINGRRVCNLDTMVALEKRGFVHRSSKWEWKATPAGKKFWEASK
jgi:hypothetical protein